MRLSGFCWDSHRASTRGLGAVATLRRQRVCFSRSDRTASHARPLLAPSAQYAR
jgi:hypothetical protein